MMISGIQEKVNTEKTVGKYARRIYSEYQHGEQNQAEVTTAGLPNTPSIHGNYAKHSADCIQRDLFVSLFSEIPQTKYRDVKKKYVIFGHQTSIDPDCWSPKSIK